MYEVERQSPVAVMVLSPI